MGHSLFLNSTFDMGINKRQGHGTLSFLKIDMRHGDPPSRAPHMLRPEAELPPSFCTRLLCPQYLGCTNALAICRNESITYSLSTSLPPRNSRSLLFGFKSDIDNSLTASGLLLAPLASSSELGILTFPDARRKMK